MDALGLLWLVPLAPLAGFLILFVSEGRLPKVLVGVIGAGSVGLSALIALAVALAFGELPEGSAYAQSAWRWIDVGGFTPGLTLYLDGLSLAMMGVITGVGFLIHLYATGYMWHEGEGYARFFAYMNLFVFAMLLLVLGDNLLLLYLGWEGVGLCSYLLIGFFHMDPANGYAARKAFVVTRVGDTALAIGLFLLFREFGTLEIEALLASASAAWSEEGSTLALVAALLILGGAVGKSAQLPLQTWLPDAMAGPTPVSALIHAATMVTAGVYLIARLHDLYLVAPGAQLAVALVGLATLLIASFSALVQRDLKRILAYSTMSQIGYMFLALGVGAWSAAIFHLVTHAFFKALLFLAAGSVILALHHEQDIFRMGGLWRRLPIAFASMVIGAAALAALPLTSGYYSKDAILLASFEHAAGGVWLWLGGALAAFVTALYSGRMVFVAFLGDGPRTESPPEDDSGLNMWGVLVVLAVLSLIGGWFGLPVIAGVLPDGGVGHHAFGVLAAVTSAVPILGAALAWLIWGNRRLSLAAIERTPAAQAVAGFWRRGWGFDGLYARVVERPFVALARASRNEVVDAVVAGIVALARAGHTLASAAQTGRLRWYAANMGVGTVVFVMIVLVVS